MSASRNDRRLARKKAKAERGLIAPRLRALRAKCEADRRAHHREVVAGWSFIMTIGIPKPGEPGSPSPELIAYCKEMGIEERDRTGTEYYHFSARPVPVGRDVVDEDWFNLGFALEAIRVPTDAQQRAHSQIENDRELKRHAVHFIWTVANSTLN